LSDDTHVERVRERFARTSAQMVQRELARREQLREQLRGFVPLAGKERVLDSGAGTGALALAFGPLVGRVVGLDVVPELLVLGREAAAAAGLDNVLFVDGDATALPFAQGAFDACLSQEALLHISDKARVLAECHRVLAPGGRIAFSDWIAFPRLGDREREQLWEWMAATTLQTLEGYRALLGRAGFSSVKAEDLSAEWRPIVRKRLELHRALRADGVARLGKETYQEYDQLHVFFVRLIEEGKLGGGRFTATR